MHEYPILCCGVSCYYSKKIVLRDSDRSYTTQPVQICELAIYVLEQKKKKKKKRIIHFHLKITKFYSSEILNYWPGSITLMFQVFQKSSYSHILSFKFVINDYDRYSNKATKQSHKL